jgi:hypothetical protein
LSLEVSSGNVTETQDTDVCITVLPEIVGGLLYTYLDLLSGADEVSGESWQLVTAIHDEGDGLALCE